MDAYHKAAWGIKSPAFSLNLTHRLPLAPRPRQLSLRSSLSCTSHKPRREDARPPPAAHELDPFWRRLFPRSRFSLLTAPAARHDHNGETLIATMDLAPYLASLRIPSPLHETSSCIVRAHRDIWGQTPTKQLRVVT